MVCVSQTRERSGPTCPPTPSILWQLAQARSFVFRYRSLPRRLSPFSCTSLRTFSICPGSSETSSPPFITLVRILSRSGSPANVRSASVTCGNRSRGSFFAR